MGFFRFRRSIKILPGVRWNIGKRGSSLSFGTRGFHYTVGTSGSRTTVGLPGTGLSYTSVSPRRRAVDHVSENAPRVTKTVQIEYPDREPDDPPATQRQIAYLRNHFVTLSGLNLETLGKRQASALIGRIIQEQEQFASETLAANLGSKHGAGGCATLFLIGLAVVVAVFVLAMLAGR